MREKREDYDFEKHLSNVHAKILFWNKNVFYLATIWESKKKITWWSFQIDEQMATWFVTERYCIQNINGNAKCRDIFTAFKSYLFVEKSSMIDCVLDTPLKCITLTHSFPNASFLYPLKTSENLTVFWCFRG